MSNATDDELENLSDEELEKQALEAEAKQTKAATEEPSPEPQAVDTASQATAPETSEPSVTPSPTPEPVSDRQQGNDKDPMERARRKGLDTPEALARSLASLEDEFHRRNQAGHPGYRDVQNGNPAPQPTPPQNWNPQPMAPNYPPPGYGYPPPMPNRRDVSRSLAEKYGMDPEDVERLMPMMVDAAEAIASRRTQHLERELMGVRRQSERNSEFNQLMQDPAFADPRVQTEMREVLKDGSLFQQGGRAYTTAFNLALANLARKQLQQEMPKGNPNPTNNPPFTAGGGNGSANTAPYAINEKVFLGWSEEQQKAFIESNGTKIPRR